MLAKKPGRNELAKEWKTALSAQRHAEHRKKCVYKAGLRGVCINGPGEACSTMACPGCEVLHSPGTHWLHHCPNVRCKRISVRDECAREIGNLCDTRVLLDGRRRAERLAEVAVEAAGEAGGAGQPVAVTKDAEVTEIPREEAMSRNISY
jgi:hypothetical protein